MPPDSRAMGTGATAYEAFYCLQCGRATHQTAGIPAAPPCNHGLANVRGIPMLPVAGDRRRAEKAEREAASLTRIANALCGDGRRWVLEARQGQVIGRGSPIQPGERVEVVERPPKKGAAK